MVSTSVIVGLVIVFVVLAILVALDKWGVFSDDREDAHGTDRVQTETRREESYSVSWMKKHKQLTLPSKVLASAVLVMVLATGVFGYLTLKSGAPVEVPYARYIQTGTVAVVAVFGGVGLAHRSNANRGTVEIVHEDESGNAETVEEIHFNPAETITDKDGRTVVQEHFRTRILGLFGRRKLVAHDRELRSERSLLSDVVTHQIPDHAIKVGENHYQFRTQGRETKTSPSSAADYHYRSPIQLHYQQYLNQEEKMEKLRMRYEQKDALLGEAQTRLSELQRKFETREYRGRSEAREEILEVIDMMKRQNQNIDIKQDTSAQRRATDQSDLTEVDVRTGEGGEGS